MRPESRCLLGLLTGLVLALSMVVPLSGQTTLIEADRILASPSEGIVGPRFIVVEGETITRVTARRPTDLPADTEIVQAGFVTSGFIDARTTLGLSGIHSADDDRDETSGPNQAHLRALDAFDLTDSMVRHALGRGVTTVQTGPGDANSIGGQAGVFKLSARTVEEAVVRFPSAVVLSLDESAKLTYGEARRYPSTRMANVGLIRQALLDADVYRRRRAEESPPPRDLKKEALAMVLDREVPALVSVERADEIVTALRLAEEFDFELHLVGGADALVVLDRLTGSGIPLFLGPPGDAALGSEGSANPSERAAALEGRGVAFALVTGDDATAPRTDLLDLARSAVRGGLSLEEALESITIAPARILGLDGEIGTIEEGKEADLVLFDGQPLEATSMVTAVFVGGAPVYDRQR